MVLSVYGTLFNELDELDDVDSDEPFYPVDDYSEDCNDDCKQLDDEEAQ